MNYLELFKAVAPETIVVVTAFVALLVDLAALRHHPLRVRMGAGAALASLGCVAAMLAVWLLDPTPAREFARGILVVDDLARLAQGAILTLTVFTAVISVESSFTDHVGEFFALLLLATVGMMFMVSSEDLLMIFVSLEMTSLSLYILTAFNKRSAQSAEAALKYFLVGGVSAAFTLFGLSLLYGLADSTNLREIATALRGHHQEVLFYLALVMTMVGFGFKVAAVPFHLWAPDAYQGAPTPAAALIASGSKVASFFVLAKLVLIGFQGGQGDAGWRAFEPGWVPLVGILAVLSMVLGNLAALAQRSVRRLLAYSAVAHAGYMLVGLMSANEEGMASLLFYVVSYGLTAVGAFGVVAIVQEEAGHDSLEAFRGLRRRAPLLAVCLFVFLLSLAGIPPLVGFFGKFYLFTAAVHADPKSLGLLWLVILAVAMSAVSLYYYLQVLKQVFVVEAVADAPVLPCSFQAKVALGLLALAVVVLGCAPNLLLAKILAALQQARFI